jgi:hypothetical protein
MKLITNIQSYIPANVLHDKTKVIEYVNEFLESINYILSGNHPYKKENWQERGRRLYAFSQMYINIIVDNVCESDTILREMFINYMCKPNKNNLIPMRHLYKVLTNIGLLYLDECLYFYLYDNTKNKKRIDLTFDEILINMYNAKLRYSKTNTIMCINNLESKNIHDINKYMVMAIQLRKYYLTEQFCKIFMKIKPNDKHSFFENELQGLLNALEQLMKRSNEFK